MTTELLTNIETIDRWRLTTSHECYIYAFEIYAFETENAEQSWRAECTNWEPKEPRKFAAEGAFADVVKKAAQWCQLEIDRSGADDWLPARKGENAMSWAIDVSGKRADVIESVKSSAANQAKTYEGKPEADDIRAAEARIVANVEALAPEFNAAHVYAFGSHAQTGAGIARATCSLTVDGLTLEIDPEPTTENAPATDH